MLAAAGSSRDQIALKRRKRFNRKAHRKVCRRRQMVSTILNSKWLPLALLSLCVVSGCCCEAYPLPGEDQCPTDARRLYWSCGEEAVRRCPCGPDDHFYGLKPTCWRPWPEGWQCGHCGGMPFNEGAASCAESVRDRSTCNSPTSNESSCPNGDDSNPFRSQAWQDEHPQHSTEAESLPPQSLPPTNIPSQQSPAQTPPPATPALEPVPLEIAPSNEATRNSVPASANPPTEMPPAQSTPIKTAPPRSAAAAAPSVRTTPGGPSRSQTKPHANQASPHPVTRPLKPATKAPYTKRTTSTQPHASAPNVVEALHPAASIPADNQPTELPLSDRIERHLINNISL